VTGFTPLHGGEPRPAHELLASVRAHERAPTGRPFVYVNMVATADGRATLDGGTRALGSAADTLVLTELRALADAVLIGTGTVRAEGYGRLVADPERVARRRTAGRPDSPLAVLLSRRFDIPWEAGLFSAPDQPVVVYTGERGDARAGDDTPEGDDPRRGGVPGDVVAPVEVVRLADPSPAAALADLRARGVRALLCEGGPTLNRALLAAGLVDELFLTVAPLLTGDDVPPRIVEGAALPAPATMRLAWALRHEDELFLRYTLRHGD
jgi:riboflavin biosynthesis pyrimidine reductase